MPDYVVKRKDGTTFLCCTDNLAWAESQGKVLGIQGEQGVEEVRRKRGPKPTKVRVVSSTPRLARIRATRS